MAQYNRPPRVKPAKPDEFISFFDRVVRYCLQHQYKFYAVLAAGVLGLAAYGIYQFKAGRDAQNFAADYYKAETTTESQASQTWEELLKKNPPGRLPDLIRLQWAGDLAKQQKWEEAVKIYAANEASGSTLLKDLSSFSQAVALENAGQWDSAYKIYQILADGKGSPLVSEARLGMARALSGQKKDQEAEVILLQLIGKGSDASAAIKAAALNRLIAMKARTPAATQDLPTP